jgi:hypothetical protein
MRAKSLYNSYHSKCDSYSCGKNLAEHISPDLTGIKTKFNKVMTELKELDPGCPDFQL